MTATIHKLKPPQPRPQLVCSGCGVSVSAACDCGVAYMPKLERTAKLATANPGITSRPLAKLAGVGRMTAARALKQVSQHGTPAAARRNGSDGKSYPATPKPKAKLPYRGKHKVFVPNNASRSRALVAFIEISNDAVTDAERMLKEGCAWSKKTAAMARKVATAWDKLARQLETKYVKAKT